MRRLAYRVLSCAAAAAVLAQPLRAQHLASAASIASLPAPVLLDTTGMFQAKFARLGDDIFIGGQPTEKALRDLRAQGVTVVVNLRTPEEMTRAVKFDEPALIRELGMRYVYIPMRGTPEFPYSPDAVAKFAEAVKSANGKVLLHCTVAWRASHLWAAYLIKERGVPVETATFPGVVHGFLRAMGAVGKAREAVAQAGKWLRRLE